MVLYVEKATCKSSTCTCCRFLAANLREELELCSPKVERTKFLKDVANWLDFVLVAGKSVPTTIW